jgi:poly-gamma-glutamate synthesis protein (capsule biosynthesis protein)
MLAKVAPLVSAADIAVCHVETPISPDNTALSGYPIFNAPRELADGIAAAGFDTCSIASNHALDRGFTGITATLDELDRVGVAHTGTARSAEEQVNPPIYEVGNVRVGHLSYTYGTNGIPVPGDAPWSVNVTSIDGVLVQAAALRDAGSDFTVLSIQWGNEYQQAPSPVQIEQASAFLESPDIDLIVGEHVHVAQPVDIINDKVVLYGIGNFLSNQSPQSCNSCPAASQDGMIFTVTVEETAPGVFETTQVNVTPTYVDRSFYEIVPVPQGLADPDVAPGLADALRGSWERVNQAIFALDAPTSLVTVEPMPLTP